MGADEHATELSASHARLLDSLAGVSDDQLREPCRLPGWTRDMLVAHLHFGGQAQLRGIEGVLAGGDAVMYPGEEAQRQAEIESGAGRPAAELVAEVAATCARLDDLFDRLPATAWDGMVQTRRGPVPVREILLQRWLDVEVHHVDLDLAYGQEQWPPALVELYLPGLVRLLPALRARPDADRSLSGSWHLHRTDGPGEWTVQADSEQAWVTDGHAKADCALRGPGRALLAHLLGRADEAAIDLFGDERLATGLKAAFPGP
ncbi:MAG: maleylpyruvate isomerase family mycothiol-dependent enzyme [Jatrophihabitans sp.]|uniref:maleylpyruvate isomerase family mycothiol-dependent enzyme n=1 Tax=Jatrophihabitans sp. TaxID=1932789 RepID=UPI00390DE61C